MLGKDEAYKIILVWVGAIVMTTLGAVIAAVLGKWIVILIRGAIYELPFQTSLAISKVALYSLMLLGPVAVARRCWEWLLSNADRPTVVLGLLFEFALLFIAWPALLTQLLRAELGI